jgi:ribosomal protein S24E
MEVQIVDKKDNALMKRKDVQLFVKADVTPSRNDVVEQVCKKLSCKPEVVRIKKIEGVFGVKSFSVDVEIYNSENDKLHYSPAIKKKDIAFDNSLKEKKNGKFGKENLSNSPISQPTAPNNTVKENLSQQSKQNSEEEKE